MGIKIDNSAVVTGSWSDVDQANILTRLEESGDVAAIREAVLYAPDLEKHSEWKFLHHVLEGDTLKLHQEGVFAAAQRLVSTGKAATDIPKKPAARHLLRHYRDLDKEPPESLESLKSYDSIEELEGDIQTITKLLGESPRNNAWMAEELPELLDMLAGYREPTPEEVCRSKGLDYEFDESGQYIIGRKALELDHSVSQSNPTPEQLMKINRYVAAPGFQGNGDVFVFAFMVSDKSTDEDGEHLTDNALNKGAMLAGGGHAIVTDHSRKADDILARSFDAERVGDFLRQWVFVPATETKTVERFRNGLWRHISAGFRSKAESYLCDSCNVNGRTGVSIVSRSCPHTSKTLMSQNIKKGQLSTVAIDDMDRWLETSVVVIGKNRNAHIAVKGETTVDTITSSEVTIGPSQMPENQEQNVDTATQEPVEQPTVEPAAESATFDVASLVESVKGAIPASIPADTTELAAMLAAVEERQKGLMEALQNFQLPEKAEAVDLSGLIEAQKGTDEKLEAVTEMATKLAGQMETLTTLVEAVSKVSVESIKELILESRKAEQEPERPKSAKASWFWDRFLTDVQIEGGQQ